MASLLYFLETTSFWSSGGSGLKQEIELCFVNKVQAPLEESTEQLMELPYPDELSEFPRPVVALMGCSYLHANIHKFITTRKNLFGEDQPSLHLLSIESTAHLERKN